MVSNHCVSASEIIPGSWHRKAVPLQKAVGADFIRDVEPGEIVSFYKAWSIFGQKSMQIPLEKQARCIFEYIYFARMDSVIDNINVYHARIVAGKALAESYPVDADLVVGVPDSGLVAAKDIRNIPESLTVWHSTRTVM